MRLIGFCAAVVMVANAAYGAFSYPDFSSHNNLALTGTATIVSNRMQMVPNTQQNLGSAWYGTQQPTYSFTTTFQFQYSNIGGITDDNGNPGTDGISFTLQPGGTDYTSDNTSSNSPETPYLAVRFIAFKEPQYDDPQSSNVLIDKDGVRIASIGVEPAFVYRTGNAFDATISYDGSTLDVYLNNALVASTPVSLADIPDAYVGFTAYDGGAVANQYINNWSFSSVPEPASLAPLIVMLGLTRRRRR